MSKQLRLQFIGGRTGHTKLGGSQDWKLWDIKEVTEEFYNAFKDNPDFRKIDDKPDSAVFKKNKE